MTDEITMDKKWAFRKDPFTEVRVLCNDGPDKIFPVISASAMVNPQEHTINGNIYDAANQNELDLVPLISTPREWWVSVYDGVITGKTGGTKNAAAICETIKVREVFGDD